MTTLAEHMVVAGANNRPPMLEKTMYYSWQSHILFYIKGQKNGRMMLKYVLEGPLIYPTIEVDGVTRPKTYEELSETKKLQDDCDLRATNIVLQCLPPDIYALVNHNQVVNQIWDRVKLLMQGTELSYKERECKLYNEFDKFASIKGETLNEYYMWFAQLMNDIHNIGRTMQQVQVNTRFLKGLQPEWSKFVIDVKLAKSMYTTNYDQLYAYLIQHEGHAIEVRLMRERFSTCISSSNNEKPPQEQFPQLDSGHAVPSFLPGDDPIASLNKAMAFLSRSIASRFPSTNNQLRTSSNPRNQATVQDGRVIVQQVQGRQSYGFVGNGSRSNATGSGVNRNGGNNTAVPASVVRCYNCQGEGHMARQCTQPKRPRNSAWFKEKLMLVEAQEVGHVLDEEHLAFLADPGFAVGQEPHTTMPHNAAFQTDDLDAFDSDVEKHKASQLVWPLLDIEITSDSNIISYDQYLQETTSENVQNNTSFDEQSVMIMSVFDALSEQVAKYTADNLKHKELDALLTVELESYKERVKQFEERQNADLNSREKLIESQMNDMILRKKEKFVDFQKEIGTLKSNLSKHEKENESLITKIDALKKES
ncbi:retrovirus-related pol polyprotein from transposon TNT 1-94 [Tanacetum coccineum]